MAPPSQVHRLSGLAFKTQMPTTSSRHNPCLTRPPQTQRRVGTKKDTHRQVLNLQNDFDMIRDRLGTTLQAHACNTTMRSRQVPDYVRGDKEQRPNQKPLSWVMKSVWRAPSDTNSTACNSNPECMWWIRSRCMQQLRGGEISLTRPEFDQPLCPVLVNLKAGRIAYQKCVKLCRPLKLVDLCTDLDTLMRAEKLTWLVEGASRCQNMFGEDRLHFLHGGFLALVGMLGAQLFVAAPAELPGHRGEVHGCRSQGLRRLRRPEGSVNTDFLGIELEVLGAGVGWGSSGCHAS